MTFKKQSQNLIGRKFNIELLSVFLSMGVTEATSEVSENNPFFAIVN